MIPEANLELAPIQPRVVFTNELYDELVSLVKGPVCFPSNPDFKPRTQTFNGKLKPLIQAVASPLDARDVSVIVRFCAKHNLSPSVRSGGYGIAGWAVAGDIVIDMSMIRDVDIEAPIPVEGQEGVYTWTPLADMPAPGSKGKGKAGVIRVKADAETKPTPATDPDAMEVSTPSPPPTSVATQKRPRDPTPPLEGDSPPPMDDARLRSYSDASHAVASFLSGPPLPPVPGETPREPPTNRRRLQPPSPIFQDVVETPSFLALPTLSSRQLSGDSVTSSNDGSTTYNRGSGPGSSADTVSTTPTDLPDSPGSAAGKSRAQPSPFAYATTSPPPTSPPPSYLPPGSSSSIPVLLPNAPSSIPGLDQIDLDPSPFAPGLVSSAGRGVTASTFGFASPFNTFLATTQMSPFAAAASGGSHVLGATTPAQPVHSHAYVTFGAGMRQKEIDLYTASHPLEGLSRARGQREEGVVPYHVPSSAHPVGSSTMLLGGFGFVSRMYGLSTDNLVEVELVLADGRIVILNKDEDPDLWWAVRGAGPAFGIATRYKVKAYPIPIVFAGNLIYRFHKATAASLIRHFRDCIKGVPRELYANVLLTAGPANKDSLVVIQVCYNGPKEKGLEYLQAISSWDGERCLLNEVKEKSFMNQQDSVAQVLRGKSVGRQWFIRSSLIHSLPDEVINQTVLKFANTPIGCTWIFELAGGAIQDYEDNCLPKEQREAAWTVAALHQWDMGVDDPRCITTAEDWMAETIKPVSLGGPFPVFLGRHESAGRTQASFGKNWDRLAELKARYDPEGFFKNNFWPLDKKGEPVPELYNEPPSP